MTSSRLSFRRAKENTRDRVSLVNGPHISVDSPKLQQEEAKDSGSQREWILQYMEHTDSDSSSHNVGFLLLFVKALTATSHSPNCLVRAASEQPLPKSHSVNSKLQRKK